MQAPVANLCVPFGVLRIKYLRNPVFQYCTQCAYYAYRQARRNLHPHHVCTRPFQPPHTTVHCLCAEAHTIQAGEIVALAALKFDVGARRSMQRCAVFVFHNKLPNLVVRSSRAVCVQTAVAVGVTSTAAAR